MTGTDDQLQVGNFQFCFSFCQQPQVNTVKSTYNHCHTHTHTHTHTPIFFL